ncbi:MYND-type domain-containing protein [Hirschfeldia incana]|nr:MYND-type domain-containing protein [Hirschfeldia incana]
MSSFNGDDFKGLRITQLDDDDEEVEEAPVKPINVDEFDDDDDEDDEEDEVEPVILGFVESPRFPWSNLRQLFPNLAGGVPAWLDPVNLPSGKSILCDLCEEPLQFVLQLYAPLTDKESAFHRTLFLFMCPSMSCLLRDQHEQWKRAPEKPMRSVKVFRCQLPRANPFYSSEAPKHDGTDKPLGHGAPLCTWCGTWKGDKVCGGCKTARYCSPKHQSLHWQRAHKAECQKLRAVLETSDSVDNGVSLTQVQKAASNGLWKEFVLINVDESEYDTEMSETDEVAQPMVVSKREVDDQLISVMKDYEGDADKQSWVNFQQRVDKAAAQVVRYCRSSEAKPLWPMASGRVSKSEVPNCKSCGGPRCFEFQAMPQLLFFFGGSNDRESLDWATIVVYTCENSCDTSLSYNEEFVWVQVYSQTT